MKVEFQLKVKSEEMSLPNVIAAATISTVEPLPLSFCSPRIDVWRIVEFLHNRNHTATPQPRSRLLPSFEGYVYMYVEATCFCRLTYL